MTDTFSKPNYFFRVRTVLDEHGNVKSALYGKIYGDFMQFTYYLNPTPNDHNIEFDPPRNLLGGRRRFQCQCMAEVAGEGARAPAEITERAPAAGHR